MMMMNGTSYHHHQHHQSIVESLLDGFSNGSSRSNGDVYATIPASSSLNSSPSPSPSPSRRSSSPSRANYIEHKVSKMDTLAGVAIKYGVEVADIRRMNGLVTDLQMFALDVLKIPCPGRHPPSPVVPNGASSNGEQTPPPSRQPHEDILNSLQSLKLKPPRRVSPAMSSLQGRYGLMPPKQKGPIAEAEMAVYSTGRVLNLENGHPKASPASDPGLTLQRKSRSMVSLEDSEIAAEEKAAAESEDGSEVEKYMRRRQKGDIDLTAPSPEILLKQDSGGGFFGRIVKGLALRPKIGSRADVNAGRQNSITATAGDFFSDVFVSVRKSSSTSSLQETESASSLWPTSRWSLNPDSIARPILDGFTMPMTVRKNKAALD